MRKDRLMAELSRAREKAAEWQAKVKDLEQQVTKEENTEIIQSVRSIAATPEELGMVLELIRAGKLPVARKEEVRHDA